MLAKELEAGSAGASAFPGFCENPAVGTIRIVRPAEPHLGVRKQKEHMDFNSYVSFHGRLARRNFFAYYGLPFLVLGALPGLLLPHGPTQVLLEYAVVLLVLPGIAKRLHDVDYSLWAFAVVEAVYAGADAFPVEI